MAKSTVRVYPVEGRFLLDVPAVEHDCEDPRCLASGAFTKDKPPIAADAKPEGPPEGGSSAEKES